MFQTVELAGNVEQYAVLDAVLERAAEVIAAQSMPARALMEAKVSLSRKVLEVAELAHKHISKRPPGAWNETLLHQRGPHAPS